MKLKTKASLLFLICCTLYLALSALIGVPALIFNASNNLLFFLNALLVSIPAFLIPAVVFRRVNKFPFFKAPKFWQIVLAAVIGIGCVNMNQSLTYFNAAVFYNIDVASNSTSAETVTDLSVLNLFFSLAIIPPIAEEFLMRGTLLESWRRYSPVGAMIITSLLFALLHAAPSAFIVYFAIGMLLALVYIITRNAWLTVIIHFVNNLSSVIAALFLKYLSADPSPEAVAAESELSIKLSEFMESRLGYLVYAFIFMLIAASFIVPGVLILRAVFRKKKLGKYSEGEIVEIEGERLLMPLPELKDCALANGNRIAILEDVMLWVAIDLLALINILSALSEFGIIKA